MTRRPVATGADAERARLVAADRDGVPWRRWAPSATDETGGLLGISDSVSGLRFSLTGRGDSAAGTGALDTVRYLAATPTSSLLRATARIPGASIDASSCELDVVYAKRAPEDIVIRISVTNRGPEPTTADLLTSLSFRVTSSEVDDSQPSIRAPWEAQGPGLADDTRLLSAHHPSLGTWWLTAAAAAAGDAWSADALEAGTSAALRFHLPLDSGETRTVRLRLSRSDGPRPPIGADAEATLGTRARESLAFQKALLPTIVTDEECRHSRGALAALLWSPPPDGATAVDRTFAALGLAVADPVAGQHRLSSIIDEGRAAMVASTEPPVGAWAALRIHELVVSATGRRDHGLLEHMFHGLLDDYSCWVDRLDPSGRNPLQGGLLDLDGVGGSAAGAAWMGCFSVWMLSLAIELARDDASYQDVAVTFLESTLAMATSLDDLGGGGVGMWDEEDGWHHDVARGPNGDVRRQPGRSVLGLVPILAIAVIPREALARLPEVAVRLGWSMRHGMDPAGSVVRAPRHRGSLGDMMVSLVPGDRRLRALTGPGLQEVDISPVMACLLLDVLDRLRAFDGDHADLAVLQAALLARLTVADAAPAWATLLARAMGRAR